MIDMREEHERLTGEPMLTESEIVHRAQHRVVFSGVHFLIRDGRIVYVGQGIDVERRIAEHRRNKDFDSFTYVQAFGDQLDVLESMYIHHFQPEYNAQTMQGVKAPLTDSAIRHTRVPLKALSGLIPHPAATRRVEPEEEGTIRWENLK